MPHKAGWRYKHLEVPDPQYHYYVVIKVSLHDPIQETPLLPQAIKSRVFNGITNHLRYNYPKTHDYRNIKVKLDHVVDLNKKEAGE